MGGNDLLKAFRARDLTHLVESVGHLDVMPYTLMIRVLDHIEVGLDGSVIVIFLAGTQIGCA